MIKDLKKIGKQSMIYGFARALAGVFGILIVPVLTKNLELSSYGVVDLILTLNSFLMIFLMLGLDSAAARYFFESDNTQIRKRYLSNAFFLLVLELGVVVFLLLTFTREISNLIFQTPDYHYLLGLDFIAIPFLVLYNYFLSIFIIRFKPWPFVVISSLNLVINLALTIILVMGYKMGLKGAILAYLLATLSSFALAFVFNTRNFLFSLNKKYLKPLVKFGLPLLPAGIALWALDLSDRFFILKYLDTEQLAIYSIGVKVTLIVSLIVLAFILPWNPFALSIRRQKNAKDIYAKFLNYFLIFGCFFALLATFLSRPIILLLANEKYLDASYIVGLLTLGTVAYGSYFIFALGTNIVKKTWFISLTVLIAAAFNISLNFYFIPKFGILGAGLTTASAYFLSAVLMYIFSQRYYHIDYELKKVSLIVGLTIFLVGIFYLVSTAGYQIYLLALGALLFYGLFIWRQVLAPQEIKVIKRTVETYLKKMKKA